MPNLTSVGFIVTLRTFIARRGKYEHSDNTTDFIGAKNLLLIENNKLAELASKENFEWHFIPPRSPNHGKLWEAAVKSSTPFNESF